VNKAMEAFGLYIMLGSTWIAAQLAVFQEAVSSMELTEWHGLSED
jgi:hypothetical protein